MPKPPACTGVMLRWPWPPRHQVCNPALSRELMCQAGCGVTRAWKLNPAIGLARAGGHGTSARADVHGRGVLMRTGGECGPKAAAGGRSGAREKATAAINTTGK